MSGNDAPSQTVVGRFVATASLIDSLGREVGALQVVEVEVRILCPGQFRLCFTHDLIWRSVQADKPFAAELRHANGELVFRSQYMYDTSGEDVEWSM